MQRVYFIFILIVMSCSSSEGPGYQEPYNPDNNPEVIPISNEDLLNLTQQLTFKYFWDFANTPSGAARERYHVDNPNLNSNVVTTGGSGFGLMAILVGIERGYITRSKAVVRLQTILDFFENADRFHGAWSHWIDGNSGNTIPFSSLDNGGDLVETAFLAQGLICIKEYFKNGTQEEQNLANQADNLWKGVEWDWYTQNQETLYWHWSPNHNFDINLELKGYNETLITYILAAASPDYPINPNVYTNGWANNGAIVTSENQYNTPLILDHAGAGTGPLFWAHYSYLGLNPNNLSDQYADYWSLNKNHTTINYQHCVSNPNNFTGYGSNCWGLTASYSRNNDGSVGYNAHDPENDTGVISPTAAISSIPYTPEKSLAAMQFFYQQGEDLLGPAGFYDAFSPHYNWYTKRYLAIDQGPEIIMIENYRSGLLWNLFMQNQDIQNGLNTLGFSY
ncbi:MULTISPECIES: glucoamylase family protein [Mesoflavibacter]|nr:hypothetical protein C7H62_0923 [Mesoflavibacter sp. HG96]QIJ91460.1 hypothetical protein C7H56_0923 [Mesoflavibacter sp. HG37]